MDYEYRYHYRRRIRLGEALIPTTMNTTMTTGKRIDDQELKRLMLSILQDIDRFCKEHGLRYFLAYGSLLGSVRHKGYIPWDDDVDIWMPRPDYMLFMKQYEHPYYKACSAEFTPGWDHFIAKICDERTIIDEGHGDFCGVYVDVFPLDGWPEDPSRRKAHYRDISSLLRLWSSLHYTQHLTLSAKNGFQKNIKILASRVLGLFSSSEKALKRILAMQTRYPFEDASQVGTLTDGDWIVPKACADHLIEGEFEGEHFMIPKEFDTWLTALYGDYMQLPPIEKRVSTHGSAAFWKA